MHLVVWDLCNLNHRLCLDDWCFHTSFIAAVSPTTDNGAESSRWSAWERIFLAQFVSCLGGRAGLLGLLFCLRSILLHAGWTCIAAAHDRIQVRTAGVAFELDRREAGAAIHAPRFYASIH